MGQDGPGSERGSFRPRPVVCRLHTCFVLPLPPSQAAGSLCPTSQTELCDGSLGAVAAPAIVESAWSKKEGEWGIPMVSERKADAPCHSLFFRIPSRRTQRNEGRHRVSRSARRAQRCPVSMRVARRERGRGGQVWRLLDGEIEGGRSTGIAFVCPLPRPFGVAQRRIKGEGGWVQTTSPQQVTQSPSSYSKHCPFPTLASSNPTSSRPVVGVCKAKKPSSAFETKTNTRLIPNPSTH